MWMDATEVVTASLDALDSEDGQVLVVPGQVNRELARMGLQQQLDALQ